MTQRLSLKVNEEFHYIENLPTYGEIVATFGEILAEASDDDYQGDSLYLIKTLRAGVTNYGILEFGWGSCSGCDALQAVDSQAELDELQDALERGIKWFDSLDFTDGAKGYLLSGAYANSYLDEDLLLRFCGKVAEVRA